MGKVLFVFVAAALAVPAFAAADNSPAQPQPQKPKKEKQICKRIADSGSRIATSVCKTAAEWEKDPSTGEGSRSSVSGRPSGD